MQEYIAERELMLIQPSGMESVVTIRIGRPYKVDDLQWSCPVIIEGFHKKLADQSGNDSFQSLMLAQKLIRDLLNCHIEDGGQILSAKDRSPIDIMNLFESGI
jgi:hypothetical protein